MTIITMKMRFSTLGFVGKQSNGIKENYLGSQTAVIRIILDVINVKKIGKTLMNSIKTPPLDFVWTPAGTDITERWRTHHGWIPPSELPEYQRKWTIYQELPLRKLTDEAKKEIEQMLTVNKVKRWKVK